MHAAARAHVTPAHPAAALHIAPDTNAAPRSASRSYDGLGKAGWQRVHDALAAGPSPVPTVKAYEDSLSAQQLAVIKQLSGAAAGPAPATTTGPSAAQASTDSTTTTSGAYFMMPCRRTRTRRCARRCCLAASRAPPLPVFANCCDVFFSGAKEPLQTFEDAHQMFTPVRLVATQTWKALLNPGSQQQQRTQTAARRRSAHAAATALTATTADVHARRSGSSA